MAKIEWHGDKIVRKVETVSIPAGLDRAAIWCVQFAQRKMKIGNLNGDNPSLPGQYPHRVTGTLVTNISRSDVEITGTKASIKFGVKAGATTTKTVQPTKSGKPRKEKHPDDPEDYAVYLEYGTSRMAARPFLRPTVENNKPQLQKQFVAGCRVVK